MSNQRRWPWRISVLLFIISFSSFWNKVRYLNPVAYICFLFTFSYSIPWFDGTGYASLITRLTDISTPKIAVHFGYFHWIYQLFCLTCRKIQLSIFGWLSTFYSFHFHQGIYFETNCFCQMCKKKFFARTVRFIWDKK